MSDDNTGGGYVAPGFSVAELGTMEQIYGHSSHTVSVVRGARNGFYYGARTRAMHSIVMAVLFKKGPLSTRLKWIMNNTWEHGRNLGGYVFIYKAVLIALMRMFGQRHPAMCFVAALVGSYFWFTQKTPVNQQMCLYLLARITTGSSQKLANAGMLPNIPFFHLLSMICWGIVMFLFEDDRSVLQPSLQSSMQFIYKDSESYKTWRDFVPFYVPF